MKLNLFINLTWSKIMAFLIFATAIFEDIYFELDGKIFMVALPVIVILITGKQLIDWREGKNNETN